MASSALIDMEMVEQGAEALGREEMIKLCRLMASTCLADARRLAVLDAAEKRRTLHSLAGAAASCGAERLAVEARRLERSPTWSDDDFETLCNVALATQDWINRDLPLILS